MFNCTEEYFFTRLDAGKTVCIPGHGQHLTGLGHVEDLAVAMAQVKPLHFVMINHFTSLIISARTSLECRSLVKRKPRVKFTMFRTVNQ